MYPSTLPSGIINISGMVGECPESSIFLMCLEILCAPLILLMTNLTINLDKSNYLKQEGYKKIFEQYAFMEHILTKEIIWIKKMDDSWTLLN